MGLIRNRDLIKLQELMILRDRLVNKILYGLREVDKTANLDLVEELERLIEEARFVSKEITDLLENKEGK